MKLTFVLLTVGLLQVHAKGLSQLITLSGRDIPIQQIFTVIKKQTGYNVFGSKTLLETAHRISVDVKNMELTDFLKIVLSDQPFQYEVSNNTIIISEKSPTPGIHPGLGEKEFSRLPTLAPPIRGVIKDVDGKPLDGINVAVKGTRRGTRTDAYGGFNIDANAGEVLVISSVAFESKEVVVAGNEIYISLKKKVSEMEEVVVNKGYYSTSKKLNTGSVSKVTAEQITQQPVGNPIAALYARVPGLYIQQISGLPGASFEVQLRGQNSISNGNAPLYVIDGVPFVSSSLSPTTYFSAIINQSPFNNINPADIESITVLKDADATAIYGSTGANGVILITTKKGQSGNSRLSMNYYRGAGKVTKMLDLMDTKEYLEMRFEALQNDDQTPSFLLNDVNGTWSKTKYTDWQEVFIGGTADVHDAQLRFSGGNSYSKYTLSGGYRKETTIFPGNYSDRKASFQGGFDHNSVDRKFYISFSAAYNFGNNTMPEIDFINNITMAPNTPDLLTPQGKLNWDGFNFLLSNPFASLFTKSRSLTSNLQTNAKVSYEIVRGLKFSNSIGYNNRDMKQNILTPALGARPPHDTNPLVRSNREHTARASSWIVEPQLSYQFMTNIGQFDLLTGLTFRETNQDILTLSATGFSADALIENLLSAANIYTLAFGNSEYRYNAIYGRIGFNSKGKYLLNLTGRRDGSSRFGPGKQFGNFGAVGSAWIFSEEKFFKPMRSLVNFGKLRMSYGITGNDQLQDYQFLSTYQSNNYVYFGSNGLLPTRLTNPLFSWETVKKMEVALDLGLFNNNLQLNINYYKNRTENQLVGYPLSFLTGFNNIQANLPAKLQNTGLEIEINTNVVKRANLQWNLSANISLPRNKLLAFPDLDNHPSYNTTYKVGYPLNAAYRFEYIGIDSQTGLYTFKDFNNDGVISYEDDRRFIKRKNMFFGGLNSDFRWKNFNVSLLFQFVSKEASALQYIFAPGMLNTNQPRSVMNRWQKPGDEKGLRYAAFPQTSHEQFLYSTGNVADGSFIRLKNISCSYSVNRSWTQKHKIDEISVFIQCQNLFTISGFEGLDPENGSSFLTLPPLKMLTAGFSITL